MKKIFFVLMMICIAVGATAQSNVTVSYVVAFPTGDLGDFITKTSWRGFSMDYRYKFQPNMAAGINIAWTTFYEEKDRGTYTADNIALTGKQFRYTNTVPIVATLTYFGKPDEQINPFASVGVGTMYTRRNTDMNFYTVEQEAWNFVIQPEIGVQIAVGEAGAGVAISAKYNYGIEAGEIPEPQSYIALNIGFVFF
jgi:hypothetical protein